MFLEADFWVAVSFFIFVGIALKAGAGKAIIGPLDERTRRIASELAEARRFRDEAEALLREYETRRKSAEAEAKAIVDNAQAEAARIADEAHAKLTDFVARRTAAAEARIAQAEVQAAADVKAAAVDAAVKASAIILQETLKGHAADDILEKSLSEVRAQLH